MSHKITFNGQNNQDIARFVRVHFDPNASFRNDPLSIYVTVHVGEFYIMIGDVLEHEKGKLILTSENPARVLHVDDRRISFWRVAREEYGRVKNEEIQT